MTGGLQDLFNGGHSEEKQFRGRQGKKVERKSRNVAMSGQALAGPQGACVCSGDTALREGSQSRVLGRYQQDERDSERMCG